MGVQLYRVEPFEHPQENAAYEMLCRAALTYLGEHDGRDANDSSTAVDEAYDPATNSWTSKTPMPTARNSVAAATAKSKVYVAGGMATVFETLDVTEIYDPATDTWAERPALPAPATGFAMATSGDGRIFAFGANDGGSGTPKLIPRPDRLANELYSYPLVQLRRPLWAKSSHPMRVGLIQPPKSALENEAQPS